jgi:phosphoribosyl 1,2-cyclic phosphodiesterase
MQINVFGSSSKGNCYHVDSSSPLLLDAGLPFKEIQRRLNFQTSSIAGVLITHQHMDHCKAVKDLIKAGIDCYMNQATCDVLGVVSHRIKVIAPMEQIKINEWAIMAFPLEHDVDNLGYLISNGIEKILYITDTSFCRFKFNGVTRLLIEANYSYEILKQHIENDQTTGKESRLINTHFALEDVKEFLIANDFSKLKEIILIHLSDGNSDAELFKKEIAELTGKIVRIGGETC